MVMGYTEMSHVRLGIEDLVLSKEDADKVDVYYTTDDGANYIQIDTYYVSDTTEDGDDIDE